MSVPCVRKAFSIERSPETIKKKGKVKIEIWGNVSHYYRYNTLLELIMVMDEDKVNYANVHIMIRMIIIIIII